MIEIGRLSSDFAEKARLIGIGRLSKATNVDRSTIWRLSRGRVKLISNKVRTLCEAAGLNPNHYVRTNPLKKSAKLSRVLAETWDGTPAHADALCSVLKALRRIPRIKGKLLSRKLLHPTKEIPKSH